MNECWDNELSWPNEAMTQPTQAPTLAEAAEVINRLINAITYYVNSEEEQNAVEQGIDMVHAIRIQAHQAAAEAWFNVGAGEQVDNSAECE